MGAYMKELVVLMKGTYLNGLEKNEVNLTNM